MLRVPRLPPGRSTTPGFAAAAAIFARPPTQQGQGSSAVNVRSSSSSNLPFTSRCRGFLSSCGLLLRPSALAAFFAFPAASWPQPAGAAFSPLPPLPALARLAWLVLGCSGCLYSVRSRARAGVLLNLSQQRTRNESGKESGRVEWREKEGDREAESVIDIE